jgi:hypothetical protein
VFLLPLGDKRFVYPVVWTLPLCPFGAGDGSQGLVPAGWHCTTGSEGGGIWNPSAMLWSASVGGYLRTWVWSFWAIGAMFAQLSHAAQPFTKSQLPLPRPMVSVLAALCAWPPLCCGVSVPLWL